MHVILVEPISIRPKRRAKTTTGRRIHATQSRPIPVRPPVFQHRNPLTIVQRKPCDIDGIALGMFRDFRPTLAVPRPTRVMRNHSYAGYSRPQRPHCWLRPAIHPVTQSPRCVAVQDRLFIQRNAGNEMHLNRAADTTCTTRNLYRW